MAQRKSWIVLLFAILTFGPGLIQAERDVFRANTIFGAGGNEKSPAGAAPPSPFFSYFCLNKRILPGDFNNDGFPDFVAVADGAMMDKAYTAGFGSLAAGDYFFNRYPNAPVGTDGFPDPSPNVQLGLQAGDPWGNIQNPFNKTSDLAVFQNLMVGPNPGTSFGHFRMNHIVPLPANVPANIYSAQELAVGSLDGSDPPDIVVWTGRGGFLPPPAGPSFGDPQSARSSVVIYKNNSFPFFLSFREQFLFQRELSPGSGTFCNQPVAGTLADLDGDNDLDILVACYDPAAPPLQASLFYYRNDGAGGFDSIAPPNTDPPIPITDGGAVITNRFIRKVVTGYINGDARIDIVYGQDDGAVNPRLFYLQHNVGNDYIRTQLRNNFPVRAIAVGELTGGGFRDVVAGGGGAASPLTLFYSQGVGWNSFMLPGGNQLVSEIGDIKISDLNNDGLNDIVAVAGQNGASAAAQAQGWDSHVMVWINLGDANGTPGPEDWQPMGLWERSAGRENTPNFPGPAWGSVAIDDFDGDGDNDIVSVTRHWPMVYFENTFNTIRKVHIRATAENGQTGSVVYHSTGPLGGFTTGDGIDWGKP